MHFSRRRGEFFRCFLALGVLSLTLAAAATTAGATRSDSRTTVSNVDPVGASTAPHAITRGLAAAQAAAAVACPSAIPVVDENNCHTGSSAWEMSNYDERVGGFATKTSFNRDEAIPLKIGRNAPTFPTTTRQHRGLPHGLLRRSRRAAGPRRRAASRSTTLHVRRAGRHHRQGRLRQLAADLHDPVVGPAASGVYIAKLTTTDSLHPRTTIVFVVRDDNAPPPSRRRS